MEHVLLFERNANDSQLSKVDAHIFIQAYLGRSIERKPVMRFGEMSGNIAGLLRNLLEETGIRYTTINGWRHDRVPTPGGPEDNYELVGTGIIFSLKGKIILPEEQWPDLDYGKGFDKEHFGLLQRQHSGARKILIGQKNLYRSDRVINC